MSETTLTSPSTISPLQSMLHENYSLRELWTTPAYGAFAGYTGSNVKFTVDSSYNLALAAGLSVGSNVGGSGSTAFSYTIGADPLATVTAGGFVQVYGSTHATLPGVVTLGNSSTTRMRLDSNGDFLQVSSGSIGYGTGSGGSVTQTTSKSTTVTLNKPCGQITMHNAALASGATVQFLLSNTLIGLNDTTITLTQNETVSGANYNIWGAVGTDYCRIMVKNVSGGSLSEAVVINFAINKIATS
jgi:hypothetical protein